MAPLQPQLHLIPLKDIALSRTNPRKEFDQETINELALSIKEKGLIQPITVRPKGKAYELVCGERRFKAAKIAGLTEISAVVRILEDDEVMEIQIVENLQRKDVHPMDEAVAFKHLIEKQKLSREEIAKRIGKTTQYVAYRERLSLLIPEYQKAFYEGRLKITDAQRVTTVCAKDQADLYKRYNHKKGTITVDSDMIEHYHGDLTRAPFDINDEQLVPAMGACIFCQHNTASSALLFPQEAKWARCKNSECFRMKATRSWNNKLKEATKDPSVLLVAGKWGSSTNELKLIKDKGLSFLNDGKECEILSVPEFPQESSFHPDDYDSPEIAQEAFQEEIAEYEKEMTDYRKKIESGKYQKAFVISGNDKGAEVYVSLIRKAMKEKVSEAKANSQPEQQSDVKETVAELKAQIAGIKDRQARALELDMEKDHVEYYQALAGEKTFLESADEIMEQEKTAMIILLCQTFGYGNDALLKKILGVKPDHKAHNVYKYLMANRSKIRIIYNRIIRTYLQQELRTSQPSQGMHYNTNGKAATLRDICKEYCPEGFQKIEKETKQEREERAKKVTERISGINKKIYELEKGKKAEGKKKEKGKGLKVLLTDADDKKKSKK